MDEEANRATGIWESLDFPFLSRITIHTIMLLNGWEPRLPHLIQFSLMHVSRQTETDEAQSAHAVAVLETIPTLRGCYKKRKKLKLKGGVKILFCSQISCGEYS
jgi:hypothetical protein